MYIYPVKVKLLPFECDGGKIGFDTPKNVDLTKTYIIVGISETGYLSQRNRPSNLTIGLMSCEGEIPFWYPIRFCKVIEIPKIKEI